MTRKIEAEPGKTPRIESQVFQDLKTGRGLSHLRDHQVRFVLEKNPDEQTIHTVESREKELALAKNNH